MTTRNKIIAGTALAGGILCAALVIGLQSRPSVLKNDGIKIEEYCITDMDPAVQDEQEEPVKTFACTGYFDMELSKDEDFYLYNDPGNAENNVFVKYFIEEGDRLIYESGYIAPGDIDKFKASRIGAGEHFITITEVPYVYDEENNTYSERFPGIQKITVLVG